MKTPYFLACLALIAVSFPPAFAEGFPEKGNRADWSDAIPYYNLGNRYLEHQRFQEAATNFEDAIAIYPYDPDFYVNLGVTYRKLNDYPNAERVFKKAAELNPKDWMAWSNLANAYLKQDKYTEVKKAFEQTLKCNPPASEKAAIQKDMIDLAKIIAMQERNNAAAKASKAAAGAKVTTATKQGSTGAKSAAARSNAVADTVHKPAPPPSREQLKQGGWDYVY
ncbi:MAG: tetratricopeptide repeat protein [Candidatus Obscuribacterales bacterium]|nr:tetratricopeptide repeat protein [Candidatus Obscuribacterales bacterium]